jgi:hypothetical protein
MPQALSAKERSLFQTVVRNYEDKQYKKGEHKLSYSVWTALTDKFKVSRQPIKSSRRIASMGIH